MNRAGTVKRTVTMRAPPAAVWRRISDIAGMPAWAAGVRKTVYLSEKRRGVGAARLITFDDGRRVEEHVTAWKAGESYTYVATAGLPVRAYVATVSVRRVRRGTAVTWESYTSARMSGSEFDGFLAHIGAFYESSLCNLGGLVEARRK